MTSISERVALGAKWLDVERPDWIGVLDVERLNMASRCDCVIGQVFGDYMFGPLSRREALVAGFQVYADETYEELQCEWVRVITERREAATNAGS